MLAMGFSFDLLTLLAMVLAIRFVVDDAIVVVENIIAIWRRANHGSAVIAGRARMVVP